MVRETPTARLLAALGREDLTAVRRAMRRRVRLVLDTGDADGRVVVGRTRVAEALTELCAAEPLRTLRLAGVNGRPGIVLSAPDGGVRGVVAIAQSPRRVTALWAITAPAKLARWRA